MDLLWTCHDLPDTASSEILLNHPEIMIPHAAEGPARPMIWQCLIKLWGGGRVPCLTGPRQPNALIDILVEHSVNGRVRRTSVLPTNNEPGNLSPSVTHYPKSVT
jgi:hypothetical protein